MQKKLQEWKTGLKREDEFKNFYLFVFDYLREERKILSMVHLFEMTDISSD